MDAESEAVQAGKLRQLPSGEWYVHCKWCDEEARLQAPNEDEACRMLGEWRLSMPCRPSKERFWSCPTCAEGHQDPKPTTTDTAESASQEVDDLKLEVQQLKAEVVELKAEVERLKAEVVELKYEDNVMREIAEETGRCGESLLVYSVDVPSPCVPVSVMRDIAENMEQDGIRLRTLSSRLHQLLRQRSSASSGEV